MLHRTKPGRSLKWGLIGAAAVLTVPLLAACGSSEEGIVLSFYTAADGAEQYAEAAANCTAAAGGGRGAVMLGDEMIDEASRKMALVIWPRGAPRV